MIGWSARNITITNNYIGSAPPYGYGIAFDVKYIAYDINISDNIIEHIGDGYYLKDPCYIENPGLWSVKLDDIRMPPGAAIELESTNNIFIENNTIRSCLNGISTAFPDAIGNYGNISISHNRLYGLLNYTWLENGKPITAYGIGIGLSTYAWHPEENQERYKVYSSTAIMNIFNNYIYNYTYPIILDIEKPNLKKSYIIDNIVDTYVEFKLNTAAYMHGNQFLNKIFIL